MPDQDIEVRLAVDGEVVDAYKLPEHEYYELRSPTSALITELSRGDGA